MENVLVEGGAKLTPRRPWPCERQVVGVTAQQADRIIQTLPQARRFSA